MSALQPSPKSNSEIDQDSCLTCAVSNGVYKEAGVTDQTVNCSCRNEDQYKLVIDKEIQDLSYNLTKMDISKKRRVEMKIGEKVNMIDLNLPPSWTVKYTPGKLD